MERKEAGDNRDLEGNYISKQPKNKETCDYIGS